MARAGFSCLVWISLLGAVCSNVAAQAASASAILSFAAIAEALPVTEAQQAMMKRILEKRSIEALARLDAAATDAKRFYALPDAATGAFHLQRFALASQLATESLELSKAFPKNWNHGNAIHRAHTVLGLLALHAGDIPLAVRELHEAGATPGSPQLDSFGPSMQLARALLREGQAPEVLAYLEQCRVFWETGAPWLDIWEEKIRAGREPNFLMNLW